MSDDLGEAIGAILGITFGGIILLKIGAEMDSTDPINFEAWGIILISAAVLVTILLVFGIFKSIVS